MPTGASVTPRSWSNDWVFGADLAKNGLVFGPRGNDFVLTGVEAAAAARRQHADRGGTSQPVDVTSPEKNLASCSFDRECRRLTA